MMARFKLLLCVGDWEFGAAPFDRPELGLGCNFNCSETCDLRVTTEEVHKSPIPKGPKYLYGTKYGFCSNNFPYGFGKYTPYGYLGPFGYVPSEWRHHLHRERRSLACQGRLQAPSQ